MPENERIKELKLLKSSYEMYEKTKKDTETRMRQKMNPDGSPFYRPEDIKDKLGLIESMQKDVVENYKALGGNLDELTATKRPGRKSTQKRTVMDAIRDDVANGNENKPAPVALPVQDTQVNTERIPELKEMTAMAQEKPASNPIYDAIPLPSNGECYPNKMSRVRVAYLTAYDENILVSPNLYRDNKVLDEIIKNKLVNCPIDPAELLQGDRDAIILWLRATGYGNEFPITATDNRSGKNFDAVVDLSKIKFKPFNLKGDENGFFDYETPVGHDKIKFKFLTVRDNEYLQKLDDEERGRNIPIKLGEITEEISSLLESDKILDRDAKQKIYDAQNELNKWKSKYDEDEADETPYTNLVTNRMQLLIMEVNGSRDRKFIRDFVMSMNVRDASAFRKYVTDNEPGLDFNIEVERPESLGGGTVSVFLQLDQFLFLNTN